MKPLLVIPPAPARWPALRDLLAHKGDPWLHDIERRMTPGVSGAEDVFTVMPDGGELLGNATINKAGDVGLLSHVFTRPAYRRRGIARQLTEAALSWFDMTGGKWLFIATTSELDQGLYRKFGFAPLRRAVWAPYDRLTMLRVKPGTADSPDVDTSADVTVRDLSRADWPAMVALLQYRDGPDPRVPLDESAVGGEIFTLDLLDHLERDKCVLKGAFAGPRLIGIASVATDQPTPRTYAMLMPYQDAPRALRQSAIAAAHERGYERVDFPMETLEQLPAWAAAGPARNVSNADETPKQSDAESLRETDA